MTRALRGYHPPRAKGHPPARSGAQLMDIAVGLPTQEPSTTRESVLAWATLADKGGFSSLMARERVETTLQEPLVALSVAAGATERIRLLASTILPATRE